MTNCHFHHFNQSLTKCSRGSYFRNLHCNKLNGGAYVETLIINDFSLMIWPRFIKLSWHTYMVVKQIKCTLSLSLMMVNYTLNHHWYETSLLLQAALNYICGVQRFHCQKVCTIERPFCILTKMKKSVWHCFISNFVMFTSQFALLHITSACDSHCQVRGSYVCHNDI